MAESDSDDHEAAERHEAARLDPAVRKFNAKRVNEHVKSVYAFANTLAAAIIGAAYIIPSVTKGAAQVNLDAPGWVLIGLTLHGFGHLVIWRFMRRED